jgi:hypothetical protein
MGERPFPSVKLTMFPFTLFYPLADFLVYPCNDPFYLSILPESVDKLAVRIHEIEEDGVVDEIIVIRFGVWRSGEVYTVGFTNRFHLLISSCETHKSGMKVGEVRSYLYRCISRRIDRDEKRLDCRAMFLF